MENFSPEVREMLQDCQWVPSSASEKDWEYYHQRLAELDLELHASAEHFLNTYHDLEISYIPPQIEDEYADFSAEEIEEAIEEGYYETHFYFWTGTISFLRPNNLFSLENYNRITKKNFLPIGQFFCQFGQPSFDAFVIMNELGEIHMVEARDRSWFEFDSIESFFAAIAREYILEKRFFF